MFFLAYATTAIVFLALDAVWLSVMAGLLYRPLLGPILLDSFRIVPAAIFYLIYVTGVVWFAVLPALRADSWTLAAGQAALLGLVAYGTYDLTNHATLKDWPTSITIADLAWGTTVTALSATMAFFITRRLTQAFAG